MVAADEREGDQRALLNLGHTFGHALEAEIGYGDRVLHGAKSDLPWTHLLAPGLATIVLTFVAYLPGWLFETDLWVRVQAARDPSAARRGVALAGVNAVLFVGILPLFIGVAALSIFPHNGGFPAELGNRGRLPAGAEFHLPQ